MPETRLDLLLEQGDMTVREACEHVLTKIAYRTHCMGEGDIVYAILPDILKRDRITVERVKQLNNPQGHFTTDKGTTGPVSGNVFVKINRGAFPTHALIVGDNVRPGNGSVYDAVNEYLQKAAA